MHTLSEWVRNLVVLVFVINAAQLLLPTNTMRPYVRFVLGLVIIAVLLTSMMQLTTMDFQLDLMVFPDGVSESALPYIEQGRTLVAEARARLIKSDDGRLVSHISSIATMALGFEPERVTVQLTSEGTIDLITIVVPPSVDAEVAPTGISSSVGGEDGQSSTTVQQAARIVAGFVGVDPRQVQFDHTAYGRGGALR